MKSSDLRQQITKVLAPTLFFVSLLLSWHKLFWQDGVIHYESGLKTIWDIVIEGPDLAKLWGFVATPAGPMIWMLAYLLTRSIGSRCFFAVVGAIHCYLVIGFLNGGFSTIFEMFGAPVAIVSFVLAFALANKTFLLRFPIPRIPNDFP